MNLGDHSQSAGAAFPASTQRPTPPSTYDPDAEEFVTGLATSLVILITKWRERQTLYTHRANSGQPETTGPMYASTAAAFGECANELEAVLRQAGTEPTEEPR